MHVPPSTEPFKPVLLNRRHQVQGSSTGEVTVFIVDQWQVSPHRIMNTCRQFSFRPEPGDVLEQVSRRLNK